MYAIVRLSVEEAMYNGETHITTFETYEEAREMLKAHIENEKEFAKERAVKFEEDFYENDKIIEMEYAIKYDDYGVKYKLIDLSQKFNVVTF